MTVAEPPTAWRPSRARTTGPVIRDLLLTAASLTAGALLVAAARGALHTARELGIGPFTPYRADPWPHGIQEDDAPAFRWEGAGAGVDRGRADAAGEPSVDAGAPDELVVAPSRISGSTRSREPGDR